jgi:hypothetical protein
MTLYRGAAPGYDILLMLRTPLLLALVPALAVAGPKAGAPKLEAKTSGATTKNLGACGAKILPLVEGNQWTYEAVQAPLSPDDKVKRISPLQPKTVVITVKSVDAKKGADTVVTLEEKITTDVTKDPKKPIVDDHVITTTITCGPKKFEISPDSFLFAGEPGGYYGLKLDDFQRPKGTSLTLINGGIGDKDWGEDIVAHWKRAATPGSEAKLGSGKLELERRFTPQQPEVIVSRNGSYRAEKLALVTTGRVTLDGATPDTKPMELPAGWISTLWLAEGVGLVQALNSFSHQYQLVDAKLK